MIEAGRKKLAEQKAMPHMQLHAVKTRLPGTAGGCGKQSGHAFYLIRSHGPSGIFRRMPGIAGPNGNKPRQRLLAAQAAVTQLQENTAAVPSGCGGNPTQTGNIRVAGGGCL